MYRVFVGCLEVNWVLPGFTGFYRVLFITVPTNRFFLDLAKVDRVLPGCTGSERLFTEFYRVFLLCVCVCVCAFQKANGTTGRRRWGDGCRIGRRVAMGGGWGRGWKEGGGGGVGGGGVSDGRGVPGHRYLIGGPTELNDFLLLNFSCCCCCCCCRCCCCCVDHDENHAPLRHGGQ